MTILKKTNIIGRVEAALVNSDRSKSLASARVDEVAVSFGGFEGDSHAGLTREACVRTKHQYREGTEIRNTRQVSILSQEELAEVAGALALDVIEPEWVGANLLISGIPTLTLLPPSSRLIFEGGAFLLWTWKMRPALILQRLSKAIIPVRGEDSPVPRCKSAV